MRPKLNWAKFLRQMFCCHRFTCAETPDQIQIHWVCRKCDWQYTDFEAEADYYHNLSAEWHDKYVKLKELVGGEGAER